MTLAVTTPTGHVGSRVVRLLLQAGVRPVLLLRDPGKLDADTRGRVEVRPGDQSDAGYVARATEGVDALFWVDPAIDGEDPVGDSARLGEIAAQAVRKNRIPRVVLQSSVGAERRHGMGMIDGLARVEEALDATDASVTHLRCAYFFTNLLLSIEEVKAGAITTTLPLDQAFPWVDPRDIGDVVAARLLNPEWTGRHVQAVHGPEDLSFETAARIVSEATGRTVRAHEVTDEEVKQKMLAAGMSEKAAEAYVGMSRGQREGFLPEQGRDVVTTTPTTLGAWAYETLRPALGARAVYRG